MPTQIKSLLTNNTYCALPFVHNFQALDGHRYVCCFSTEHTIKNDNELVDIRAKILKGEKVPHCSVCYKWEAAGTISPRVKETIGLIKDPVILKTLKSSAINLHDTKELTYDIRFDNKCNLACIGCAPAASSLWAKKENVFVEKPAEYTSDKLNKIATSRKIYIAGGEPLINQKAYELLSNIADLSMQPEVTINSNIASIKPHFFEVLKKLHNLSITVSIDGHGRVNEYHRWPLQWSKFQSNLEMLNDQKFFVTWNTVVDAASVWGLANLLKIEHLTKQWNIRILQNPKELRLENLPDHLKDQAKEQFESLKNSKFFYSDTLFNSRIQLGLAQIDKPGDPTILSQKIHYLDTQRKINHQLYLGVKLT